MSRSQHLAWAKGRALEFLDQRNPGEALTSFLSDLGKHPELEGAADLARVFVEAGGLFLLATPRYLRAFVEGFN